MMRLALALSLTAGIAAAQDVVTYDTDQAFDDVVFGLENAIIGEGLVIDSHSFIGDMLARTGADVGSDKVIFEDAQVFSFCSAAVSRRVMEADPMNIIYCPYDIFVMAMPGETSKTTIGYRSFPDGPMKEVEALLDGITKAAIGME